MGLNKEILNCKRCHDEMIVGVVVGAGSKRADIAIFAQNPCYPKCLESGIPFTGGSGNILATALVTAGLTREDVWISNVVKCATKGNLLPTREMKVKCRGFLKRELSILKPRLVVTLGRFAKEDFPEGDYEIEAIPHPAWFMRRGEGEEFVKRFIGVVIK